MHLSILPKDAVQNKVKHTLADLGKIFETQAIPVNYVGRDSYHVKLLTWNSSPGSLYRSYVRLKVGKFRLEPFIISTRGIRLGLSRRYREILTLPIDEGADELRALVYNLSQSLNFSRERKFIPHITLGRVAKDLTDEEFHNLTNSIHKLNQEVYSEPIRFEFDGISLVQISSKGDSKVLKNFSI